VESIAVFRELYQGFGLDELKAAFREYASTEDVPPKPANLIRLAKAHREQRNRQGMAARIMAGEETYSCPYCRGGGYMQVELPEDYYGGGYLPCVHKNAVSAAELKIKGSFGLRIKAWKWRGRLEWDQSRLAFVPVGTVRNERQGELLTTEELSGRLSDELALPF
jgi:hypothetical protein